LSRLVYWDWARLGPMSPAAQRAQLDFVRLVAEEPSSLYFEQFLRDGFHAWPDSYQRRFPGLDTWPGVSGLKYRLLDLVQAPSDWDWRADRYLWFIRQHSGFSTFARTS
jgi:hypothetical protein